LKSIDWETAIKTRRSTRSFEMRPIEKSKMELLESFIDNIQLPFEHNVKICLFKANPDKKLYTVFQAPPDGAAFVSDTDICSISAAGFVGQAFVLYATVLGLATCWYGHYSASELERIMPHLDSDTGLTKQKYGFGKARYKESGQFASPRWDTGKGKVSDLPTECRRHFSAINASPSVTFWRAA